MFFCILKVWPWGTTKQARCALSWPWLIISVHAVSKLSYHKYIITYKLYVLATLQHRSKSIVFKVLMRVESLSSDFEQLSFFLNTILTHVFLTLDFENWCRALVVVFILSFKGSFETFWLQVFLNISLRFVVTLFVDCHVWLITPIS